MNIVLNLTWATVLLPLVGIAAAFLAESPRRAAQTGVAFTGLALVLSVVVLLFRLTHQVPVYENSQTFWDLQLTPGATGAQSLPSDFLVLWGIRVDAFSVTFMTSVLFVSLVAQVHALVSARGEEGYRRFFWASSVLTFGLLAMISSPNLFQLWLGWEVVGVASWFLAAHVWRRAEVAVAAMRTFIVLRIADLALLLALALSFARFGVAATRRPATTGLTGSDPFAFSVLTPLWHAAHLGQVAGVGTRTLVVLAVLFVVAAVIHAAAGPLHVWLTGAAGAPIAGLALVALSAPATAGILLARVYPELLEAPHLLSVIGLLGAMAAVAGAAFALAQRDLFRLGLFAVISQAGLVLTALGMGGYSPALFILFTSLPLTVLFFLCAGNIGQRYRSRDILDHGGSWRRMPRTSRGLLLWALGVSGLSLNTYSVLSATFRDTSPVGGRSAAVVEAAVAIGVLVTMALTSLYAFRVFFLVATGDPARRRSFDSSRLREAEPTVVRPVVLAALAVAVCTLVGIPGVSSFTAGGHAIPGLTFSHFVFYGAIRQQLAIDGWALLLAVVLGVAGAAAAWLLYAARRRPAGEAFRSRWARVGGLLVPPTPSERGVARVPVIFTTAGSTLSAVDRRLVEPITDSVGETTAALADLLGRLRPGLPGRSLAASLAVIVVILAASVLAVTGHFPVVTR